LCHGRYDIEKIRAFDKFAHTMHVESTVALTRK